MLRHLMFVGLAAAVACHSTEPKPSLTGQWFGSVGSQSLSLSLTDNAGAITGSGTLTNTPTGTRALTITGSFTASSFDATASSGSVQPFNIHTTVTDNHMTGTVTGSGFNGNAVTLNR